MVSKYAHVHSCTQRQGLTRPASYNHYYVLEALPEKSDLYKKSVGCTKSPWPRTRQKPHEE